MSRWYNIKYINMQSNLVMEKVFEHMNEFIKTNEAKEQLKKSFIDFFKYEDYGVVEIDALPKALLTDELWQEIANEVGEELCIIGNRVYTKTKFTEEFKSFTNN